MTNPILIMFTPDEQRTISHILTLATTLHSTCHISTGYDTDSAGRYPYTATILQKFNGTYTAMYDLCKGASRLQALLRLLREVEIDMHLAATRATREGKEEEQEEGAKDGNVVKAVRAKKTRGKGGGGEVVKEATRVAKRAFEGEEEAEEGNVGSPTKKVRTEQVVVIDDESESESDSQSENEVEEGEVVELVARVHEVAPMKIQATRSVEAREREGKGKTPVYDVRTANRGNERRDQRAGSAVAGAGKGARATATARNISKGK